jgi:hypothetical protein
MGRACNTNRKDDKCIRSFEDLGIGPIHKDNTTMDLKRTALEGVDWIHLAQDTELWWARFLIQCWNRTRDILNTMSER